MTQNKLAPCLLDTISVDYGVEFITVSQSILDSLCYPARNTSLLISSPGKPTYNKTMVAAVGQPRAHAQHCSETVWVATLPSFQYPVHG